MKRSKEDWDLHFASFAKKNLHGYSCANGGGASTDSVGRRTLEETNLVVGHSNTKTTLTQGWLGVAIVITSNILSRAERALSLTQTDSCVLRSRRWLLSEKKARCPWQVDFLNNCMQLGVEMFWYSIKILAASRTGLGISLGTHHQTAELREWSEKNGLELIGILYLGYQAMQGLLLLKLILIK